MQKRRYSQGIVVKEVVGENYVLGFEICQDLVGGLPSLLHEDGPRQFLPLKRQGQSRFFYVL